MPLRTDRAATINPPDVRLNIDQNIAWRKRRVRHNELLNASPWCHPGPRTANASRSAQPPPAEHTACTPRDTSDPKCIREKPPLGVPLGATGDSQACAPPSEWGWGHRLRLYTSHYVSRGPTTVQPLFAFYASRLIYVDRRVRPSAAEPAVQVACGPLSHHGRMPGCPASPPGGVAIFRFRYTPWYLYPCQPVASSGPHPHAMGSAASHLGRSGQIPLPGCPLLASRGGCVVVAIIGRCSGSLGSLGKACPLRSHTLYFSFGERRDSLAIRSPYFGPSPKDGQGNICPWLRVPVPTLGFPPHARCPPLVPAGAGGAAGCQV